jgi:hypothetical protein
LNREKELDSLLLEDIDHGGVFDKVVEMFVFLSFRLDLLWIHV